jgi:lambda family phage portal protein
VLEPDFLDSTRDGPTASGGYILQGVEFDALGRRRGYWLYREHPGSRTVRAVSGSTFVPEEDIAHIYRVDRPGQSRGVPWGAAAIVKLRDLADYEDAQLLRQKLAACFTAFVTTPEISASGASEISERLEPGAIEVLPPGKSVEFASPPGAEGYGEYTANVLRAIAAAFGVTYEALTGNLSSVNFSSGRMGWIEFHRNVEAWQWQMLVPQLCDKVWGWFNAASGLVGGPTAAATWTPPRREMIDPAKELNAMVTSSRSGLVSISENIRRLGYDPETVLTELANDFKLLDKLDLKLDIDPRKDKQKQEGTVNA